MKDGNICKVMTCKTKKGTWYVQEMPGNYQSGRRYVIMKDRRQYQIKYYENENAACAAMLEAVRRDVLMQQVIPGTLSKSTNPGSVDDDYEYEMLCTTLQL